jgi:hypothetical protein
MVLNFMTLVCFQLSPQSQTYRSVAEFAVRYPFSLG